MFRKGPIMEKRKFEFLKLNDTNGKKFRILDRKNLFAVQYYHKGRDMMYEPTEDELNANPLRYTTICKGNTEDPVNDCYWCFKGVYKQKGVFVYLQGEDGTIYLLNRPVVSLATSINKIKNSKEFGSNWLIFKVNKESQKERYTVELGPPVGKDLKKMNDKIAAELTIDDFNPDRYKTSFQPNGWEPPSNTFDDDTPF